MSPHVARLPNGERLLDHGRAGPRTAPSRPVTAGENARSDPRNRVREADVSPRCRAGVFATAIAMAKTGATAEASANDRRVERNPTAVQSGNRQATLLGERPRRRRSRSTVCVIMRSALHRARPNDHAEWTEAGPGREQVVRRIGPIPEDGAVPGAPNRKARHAPDTAPARRQLFGRPTR
jgi:hypothetical protein